MAYSYRDHVTRLRVHDIVKTSAAVLFLAFISGGYLSQWLSLPIALTTTVSLALLGSWSIRRHRNARRRLQEFQLDIDSGQLRVHTDGAWHRIVYREDVGSITHDDGDVITVSDRDGALLLRFGLRSIENGEDLWDALKQWGPVTEVPRGLFSAYEAWVGLAVAAVFEGLSFLMRELIPVLGLSAASIAILVSEMRLPWRHRHVSTVAQQIVLAGLCLGGLVVIRITIVLWGA